MIFILSACTRPDASSEVAGSGEPAAQEVQVDTTKIASERALERWRALIDSDLDKAYGYLSPANRETLQVETYKISLNPGLWRDIRVESTNCMVTVCEITLFLKYDLREIKGLELKKKESWILEDGDWWFVPKR